MGAERAIRYATQAKVDHAVKMAKRAGIDEIGAIEFGPDGGIRISAARQAESSGNAYDRWKAGQRKG